MVSKQQALTVLSAMADPPDRESYERAGRALGVPPGQVYLIATGLPADGGDGYSEEELHRPGVLPGSSQQLVHGHIAAEHPTTEQQVREWIRARARSDPQMQAAAARRDAVPDGPEAPGRHPPTRASAKRRGRAREEPASRQAFEHASAAAPCAGPSSPSTPSPSPLSPSTSGVEQADPGQSATGGLTPAGDAGGPEGTSEEE